MDPIWGYCLHPVELPGGGTAEVVTLSCVPYLFQNLITAALTFGGIVALFFIVWGGYRLAFSGGDAEKVKGARGTITYAILGLVLVFFSYFIIYLIATATGVKCLTYFGWNTCAPSETSYGCFYNKNPNVGEVIDPPQCIIYSENNDPKAPSMGWYEDEGECEASCKPPEDPPAQ